MKFLNDNPLIYEISYLTEQYKDLEHLSTYYFIMLGIIGFYISYVGIYTRKFTLSAIISFIIFHYIHTSSFLEAYSPALLDNYYYLFILSFLISSYIVFLLDMVRYLMGVVAVYIFYTSYLDYFVSGELVSVICLILVLSLAIFIFRLIPDIMNIVLIALFSITGNLLLMVIIEYLMNQDNSVTNLMKQYSRNITIYEIPNTMIVYIVSCALGILFQYTLI